MRPIRTEASNPSMNQCLVARALADPSCGRRDAARDVRNVLFVPDHEADQGPDHIVEIGATREMIIQDSAYRLGAKDPDVSKTGF